MVTALPSASANPLNVGYGDSALKDGSIASTSPLDIPNRAPAEETSDQFSWSLDYPVDFSMPHVARQRKQSPQKRRTSTASVEDYGVRQLSVTERLEDTGRDMYGVGEGI